MTKITDKFTEKFMKIKIISNLNTFTTKYATISSWVGNL